MAKKAKKQSAFMHWYESYNGKRVVGIIYSVGASVVIVGALFKILHWPGAAQTLMVGMFTEAFLFAIGALDKPHPEFHWEEVFPQLLAYGADPEVLESHADRPRPTLLSERDMQEAADAAQLKGGEQAKPRTAVPQISDEDVKSLKEGIEALGKTANQLASLGKVADETAKLTTNMAAAGEAAQKFAGSQDALLEASKNLGSQYDALGKSYNAVIADMDNVVKSTQEYGKGAQAVNAQIASLNSVYELQLKAIEAQSEAYKEQTAKIQAAGKTLDIVGKNAAELQAATVGALEAGKLYEASQKELAEQVAALNNVYGNMLNAIA